MIPSFAAQKAAWSSPPVDDIGYIPATELLAMDDDVFLATIDQMAHNRYLGWRNHNNNWVRVFALEETFDKNVLDYGCGVGVEALQYERDNRVWVADIVPDNLLVAERTFQLSLGKLQGSYLITQRLPFMRPNEQYDVIHCSGVLHHIPRPIPVVEQMARWLKPGGELRLMVYSDEAWWRATQSNPPEDVETDPHRLDFVRYWDAVGEWADWYDINRLRERFGKWFSVSICEPLDRDGCYLGAVLAKR